MTDKADNGEGWTQLPVVRLKEETVMHIADDIGITSQEVLSVVIVDTKAAFISAAPKDVIVEYCPEGHEWIEYQGSGRNTEDICAHVLREVRESIEKKRAYMTMYTVNSVRECIITAGGGKQTVFKRKD